MVHADKIQLLCFFLVSYLLSRVFVRFELPKRLVWWLIEEKHLSISRLSWLIIAGTALLSMLIANVVTLMAMIPVLDLIQKEFKGSPQEHKRFSTLMMLAAVWGANIGGMGMLTGTTTNGILIAMFEAYKFQISNQFTFLSWMSWGIPLAILLSVIGWLVLMLVLWLSAALESRLLKGATDNLSIRKMAANALRALLLFVGLMFALSAAGIDLTALGVLGGALGVGIGFGLQKLAANYVSGFVILAERSMRIGDMVRVDNFEGRITDITTRYTVIRALNGRESIVPNEMMITQRVENSSLADPKVALTTLVQVAYGTDLDSLMPRLAAAVAAVPRVLQDPGPAVLLSNFAADGLELTVGFWIGDPEKGQGNVRSEVNLALLRQLNADGVDIPFPQRVVHGLGPASPAAPDAPAVAP